MRFTPPTRHSRIVLGALVFSLALPVASQQEETPDEPEIFLEQVAVDIVNVEVYVTDKEGNPISGLTRGDFEVTEDGRPVEVVNFYRVADGLADQRPESALEEQVEEADSVAEEDAVRALPPLKAEIFVPESQRLHMIVYVDNYNIHPLNRNRVFKNLCVCACVCVCGCLRV